MNHHTAPMALLLATLVANAHADQLSTALVTGPAAWTSICSGISIGNTSTIVGLIVPITEGQCNSGQTANPVGTVSSSAAYASASLNTTLSGQGTAGFGVLKLRAESSAPNRTHFPATLAQGGWEDTLFHAAPTPADVGKNADLTFSLWVDGDLSAAGFNAGARMQLVAYVGSNVSHHPWDLSFGGQGFQGDPYQETVGGLYSMTIPVPLGVAFDLGIAGRAQAGPASYGAIDIINTGLVDFSHTVRWAGIDSFVYNGIPLDTNFDAASGIDWTLAAPVSEPSSALLMAAGLALFVRRRRGLF